MEKRENLISNKLIRINYHRKKINEAHVSSVVPSLWRSLTWSTFLIQVWVFRYSKRQRINALNVNVVSRNQIFGSYLCHRLSCVWYAEFNERTNLNHFIRTTFFRETPCSYLQLFYKVMERIFLRFPSVINSCGISGEHLKSFSITHLLPLVIYKLAQVFSLHAAWVYYAGKPVENAVCCMKWVVQTSPCQFLVFLLFSCRRKKNAQLLSFFYSNRWAWLEYFASR